MLNILPFCLLRNSNVKYSSILFNVAYTSVEECVYLPSVASFSFLALNIQQLELEI